MAIGNTTIGIVFNGLGIIIGIAPLLFSFPLRWPRSDNNTKSKPTSLLAAILEKNHWPPNLVEPH